MIDKNNLFELRADLTKKSQWNIGFYWAGLVYWIFILVVGIIFPLEIAKYLWLFGGFSIMPLAMLFSRFMNAEAFPKDNPLADLTGLTHAFVAMLGFPMLLVSLIFYPEAQILMMAILYCIDFYVFSWVFQSRIFTIVACVRVVAACLIWFLLPEFRVNLLPAFVASTYLFLVLRIPVERKKWAHNLQVVNNA